MIPPIVHFARFARFVRLLLLFVLVFARPVLADDGHGGLFKAGAGW